MRRTQEARIPFDEIMSCHHITPQKASDVIGCSYKYVLRLISEGQIPAVKIGASYRIPVRGLVDFIEKKASENIR